MFHEMRNPSELLSGIAQKQPDRVDKRKDPDTPHAPDNLLCRPVFVCNPVAYPGFQFSQHSIITTELRANKALRIIASIHIHPPAYDLLRVNTLALASPVR
ncbi:hypothetical protein [Profundibacter sp.]